MQNVHIATTIKKLCKSKGITISSLLSDCNLTKSFIYDLEKRATSPSCDKMSNIADHLDCSVDYLLGRTEKPSSTVNSIDGNVTGSAVVQSLHNGNVTVTNGARALTEEETELLRLFQSLDVKRRVKLLDFGFSLEGETSGNHS